MLMHLIGTHLEQVDVLTLTGAVDASLPFTIVNSERIDFVSPPGADGLVSVVLEESAGVGVLAGAYELVQPGGAWISNKSGSPITLAGSVHLYAAPDVLSSSLPLSYTAVDPVSEPPNALLLESFALEAGADAVGGLGSSIQLTVEVAVSPSLLHAGVWPQLFVYDEASSAWFPASMQQYDVRTGLLHAVVFAPARFIVGVGGGRRWWMPMIGRRTTDDGRRTTDDGRRTMKTKASRQRGRVTTFHSDSLL